MGDEDAFYTYGGHSPRGSADRGRPWAQKRSEEIEATFYRLLGEAGKQGVDLILIAGDIFHRPPLKRELKELNYRLACAAPAQVVMMAGNHDFIGEGSNYRGFTWAENVHFFDSEALDVCHLEALNTWVYGLSYEHGKSKRRSMTGSPRMDQPGYHILLAHGGDEKHVPMQKKQLMAAGFDYVALGHIHKPEIISGGMAYAGALEPLTVWIPESMGISMVKSIRTEPGFSSARRPVDHIKIWYWNRIRI